MAQKIFKHPELGDISITKRRGSKSIRLRLSPEGRIQITIPPWVPYSAGLSFLQQKKQWVLNEQSKRVTYLDDGQLIGRQHTLKFIPDETAPASRVQTTMTEVRVRHPVNCSVYDSSVQAAAVRGSKKALQRQAEAALPKRLAELSELTGLDYESASIRQLKSRWGSCSSNKHITLNYFLMILPDALIDYVLIHELAHTKHMDHGQDFWELVGQYIPDVKSVRKQMRAYQPSVFTAQA